MAEHKLLALLAQVVLDVIAAAQHHVSDQLGGGLTVADVLVILITAETLLFAAFTIAADWSAVGERRIRRMLIPAPAVGLICVLVLVGLAFGAGAAWTKAFLPFPSAFDAAAIAVALAIAIVAPPVIAALLAISLTFLS